MASDALATAVLQTLVARSTTLSSTGVSIGATPRRGMKAHVVYSPAPTGQSAVVTWTVDACYDGVPTTYFNVASGAKDVTNSLSAADGGVGGELFIPFEVSPSDPTKGVIVRIVATVASMSGSGSSVIYKADLNLGRPG